MTTLHIRARGRPAPQGSKGRGAAGQLLEQSAYLPAWRQAAKVAALRALSDAGVEPTARPLFPVGRAVQADITFLLAPEQGAPTSPPDLDKLVRSTFDAITAARVWADDAQAVRVIAVKLRAGALAPGADIMLSDQPFHDQSRESVMTNRYRLSLTDLDAPEDDPADGVLVEVTGTAAILRTLLPALDQTLSAEGGEQRPVVDPPPTGTAEGGAPRRKRRTKAEMQAARAAGEAPFGLLLPTRPTEAPAPLDGGAGAAPAASYNPFAPKG